MKELNELVQKKLNEMAESGAIEKLVSDQVEKLVANALSDTFRSYSPLSKKLEEAFNTGLDVDFGKLTMPLITKSCLLLCKVVLTITLASKCAKIWTIRLKPC